MILRQTLASVLATAGLLGIGLNAAALVLAPILRPDVNPLQDGLSRYAVGPWSEVQSAGFIALATGSLTIAGSLWLVSSGNPWTQTAAAMLGFSSLSLIGLVAFPMGESDSMTPIGDLHLTAGTLALGCQFISVAVLLPGLRVYDHAGQIVRLGLVLLGISVLGATSLQVAMWRPDLAIPQGLVMRIMIVPLLLWWAVIARTLRRKVAN